MLLFLHLPVHRPDRIFKSRMFAVHKFNPGMF